MAALNIQDELVASLTNIVGAENVIVGAQRLALPHARIEEREASDEGEDAPATDHGNQSSMIFSNRVTSASRSCILCREMTTRGETFHSIQSQKWVHHRRTFPGPSTIARGASIIPDSCGCG